MRSVKIALAAVGAAFIGLVIISVLLALLTGSSFSGKPNVAVVKIEGIITDPTSITEQLKEVGERDDIKAVVVRINSPGGAVAPSQEIHGAITRLKKKKAVVVSMSTTAASGGYYAAVAADKIVANPGTITGSIGVIIEFVNAQELLSKIGLKGYVIKSGRFKDVGSPLREMSTEEKDLLQGVIDDVNGQFIDAVAEGRGLDRARVAKIADGRIFTGAQALANGLIDSLGGLAEAIDIAAGMAGIEGPPRVLYMERKDLNLWKAVMGEGAASSLSDILSGMRLMYITTNPDR